MPSMTEIGPFEVLEPLGRGAGSSILKVRRKGDAKIYALKVVSVQGPDDVKYVEQCQLEFEVGSQLDHPNIIKVFCFERQKGFFKLKGSRLLLEFIDGKTLAECASALTLVKQVRAFRKLADGLGHMHQKGFFHADMKPENAMYTTNDETKVIDLGLVWRAGEKKDRVQGTLDFLAPEQARKKVVNAKTDIFNLGATMYTILSGFVIPAQYRDKEARGLGDVDRLIRPIREKRSDVPAALDQLVRECIAYSPGDRPGSMLEIHRRLKEISRELKAGD
jgi:serine/threonine protein kinase